MIDCHCHLEAPEFDQDLAEVVGRATAAGVEKMVTSALGAEIPKGAAIAARFPEVLLSVGWAPAELSGHQAALAWLRENQNKIVAVGEIGLDFWWVKEEKDRQLQRNIFKEFLDLAEEIGKPVVIHSRSAGEYTLDVLYRQDQPVLMHAFDGRASLAEAAAKKGFIFSIPPSICRSEQKVKLVQRLPLEALALESDAPVLGPAANARNEPANITESARQIAKIKGVSVDRVQEVTTENAKKFFQL